MSPVEIDWPSALRAPDNTDALVELRRILQNGLRTALAGRTDVCEAHIEDFAQEALMKILSRMDDFRGRSKFTTWAHSITVNVAFTELRRKRYRDVSLDEFMEEQKQLAGAILEAPEVGSEEDREVLVRRLEKCVAEKLSDKQRAIITGALAGQPFEQTVQLLGTNRNAAYKLLHDARRVLKSALLAEGISEETIRTTFAA